MQLDHFRLWHLKKFQNAGTMQERRFSKTSCCGKQPGWYLSLIQIWNTAAARTQLFEDGKKKKGWTKKKIPQSIYNFPKKKVLQTHIPHVSLRVQSSFALFRKLCVISLEKWTSFWFYLFMFIPVFVYV